MQRFTRFALTALACSSVSALTQATWSVVALDLSTREIAIACATCVPNGNIHKLVPIVSVGNGVAASQFSPSQFQNALLWDMLASTNMTPQEILDTLQAGDNVWGTRQYGILNVHGDPVTFSGNFNDPWKGGLVGRFGSIVYAIQGNSLAGLAVVEAAEDALLQTPGDLGQKVLAAMEESTAMGGDGRCSCSPPFPESCGTPPPAFTHASYTASMVIARLGDTDLPCGGNGCARGFYYMKRRVNDNENGPDAVLQLRQKYDDWRAAKLGVPDHFLTRIEASALRAPADGSTEVQFTIELRDLDDVALTSGGQAVAIEDVSSGAAVAIASPVTDNGDGTHRFTLRTTTSTGYGEWRVTVRQGTNTVRLYPDVTLSVDPVAPLHVGVVRVLPAAATEVPFTLNLGPSFAGRSYRLLGSASGTAPGTAWPGGVIPLNTDRLFDWTLHFGGVPAFGGSFGLLDANGRAEARLTLSSTGLGVFAGSRLDFCAILPEIGAHAVTNLVAVDVR